MHRQRRGPNRIDKVLGTIKAYTTRVGEGPFPTENEALGEFLHGLGREFGATTGRARRCGWFDAVCVRYAGIVNGIDELAVTNVDGLDTMETINVCVAHKLGKSASTTRRPTLTRSRSANPFTRPSPAGKRTRPPQKWSDLPPKCRTYLQAIAKLCRAKLSIVSVGPGREQTILL